MYDLSKINLNFMKKTADDQLNEYKNFDASDLVDLTDILLEKNSYARKLHDQLLEIIMRPEIQEGKIKMILP